MTSLQPIFIAPMDKGTTTDRKPFLIPDQAFASLQNAYAWRDRIKKREGLKVLGRLRRSITAELSTNPYTTINGTNTFNILFGLALDTFSPDAEIIPGTLANPIIIAFGPTINQTLTDDTGTGEMTVTGAGSITAATINYSTGVLTITASGVAGPAQFTATLAYYPNLPVMGIWQRDQSNINDEETIFFDTRFAYKFVGSVFEELVSGFTWDGTDSDFFWATNYRGVTDNIRLFFVTNFVDSASVPMRYYDGLTWNAFKPGISGATPTSADDNFLLQARILLPYFGRLIALNTIEGSTSGNGANFYNRCRFSQIGNPIQQTVVGPPFVGGAWRSDVFGKGGFIDAPVNESIITAGFVKNTLIVFFERSTWLLRYVGEYGIPFIWERITSDFGSESTNSVVIFNEGLLAVGDKGIVAANPVSVQRIDEQIPDTVFTFRNAENGVKRVIGVRNFQREIVYWCYNDSNVDNLGAGGKFPNRVLVYNYRNKTYATFRDSVTFFGTFQPALSIKWDSTTTFWYDNDVLWNDADTQSQFPFIVSGNQQGFIHFYAETSFDEPSLTIQNIIIPVAATDPVQLTIKDHNLELAEIIYLENATFLDSPGGSPIATDLNNRIFQVGQILDTDNILIYEWNSTILSYVADYTRTPTSTAVYNGLGTIRLFPKLYAQTKDFNPYLTQGGQLKISYVDFLTDVPVQETTEETPNIAMTVKLFGSTSMSFEGNLLVGNRNVSTIATQPFYPQGSDILWHRFAATFSAQFIRVVMTYDDSLMNDINIHRHNWALNAMTLWVRPGGKIVF